MQNSVCSSPPTQLPPPPPTTATIPSNNEYSGQEMHHQLSDFTAR